MLNNKFINRLVCLAIVGNSVSFASAQEKAHPFSGIDYKVEGQVTASSSHYSPTWLNANKYGLSSVKGDNGYIEVGAHRSVDNDSLRRWRVGYGVDLVGAYNFTSSFVIQQLYADFRFKNKVGISIGSKQRPSEFKDNDLSTGSQTFGTNARPVPNLRIEIPEYLSLTGKSDWVGIKGHIGYGMMTDQNWQKDYVASGVRYVTGSFLHTKAGYMRFGNEQKFPLVFDGGLEMATQFGGTIHNLYNGTTGQYYDLKMKNGVKDFFSVLYGGGSDATDGKGYGNATGNTLGSWLLSLSYKFKNDTKLRVYYDHFFEDHSQVFWQYGWKDGLIGAEITFPENPVISRFVYEYAYTKYQSGSVYHDHTPTISDQVSALDNYYNHGLYWGWQHWGQAIGNPLFRSPLYNSNGVLTFTSNRFIAHHFGIKGSPCSCLNYRILYTYTSNWGTYEKPYSEVQFGNSFLVELGWHPSRLGKLNTKGWEVKAAFAFDKGAQTHNNTGCQFTITKTGLFTK